MKWYQHINSMNVLLILFMCGMFLHSNHKVKQLESISSQCFDIAHELANRLKEGE